MAQPSDALVRLDLSLTYSEFDVIYNRGQYAGLKLFPTLGVANMAQSKFPKVKADALLSKIEDTRRAAWGGYARDKANYTEDTYGLEEHGVEELADDQLNEMYGSWFRQEQMSAIRAVNRVLQRLEYDHAQVITGWSNSTPATAVFSNFAGATPIDDIEGILDNVEDRTGKRPNKLGMSMRAWRKMIRCAQFENKLSSGSNDDPDNLSVDGFRSIFPEIEEVVFWGGYENTKAKGQTAALSRLWANDELFVGHVYDDGMDGDLLAPVPQIGRTLFHATDTPLPGANDGEMSLIIEEYREEKRRGDTMRARNFREIKTLHEDAGELLTGIL